ncbi:MAG: hypothetical protein ACKVOX_17050 [Rhizobacter sp.]
MNLPRTLCLTALLSTLIGLSSCGGGGGHDGALTTFPTAGAYGWIVRSFGEHPQLFLVHRSQPDTAYQISNSGQEAVSSTSVVSSGTVNAGAQQVTAIQPHTLVYIVNEAVRSLRLQADGAAPVSRPPVSGSADACGFGLVANDHANPLNSRLIVSRKGPLGNCSGSTRFDDNRPLGFSELRFSGNGELVSTILSTSPDDAAPVGVLRDTSTLAPRAWLYSDRVVLWNDGTTLRLSPPGTIDSNIVVAGTDRSAIVRRSGGLSVLEFPSGSTIVETPLNPGITAGTAWDLIGFDIDAFYLRVASVAQDSIAWKVLKITRSRPVASLLASGTGQLTSVAMGSNLIYAVAQPVGVDQTYTLFRINKAGGLVPQTVFPAGIEPSVQTGAAGVHMLKLRDLTSPRTANQNLRTQLQFIDENNNTLYTADQGYPLLPVAADTLNFGRSINITRFVFAANNAQSYADAMLTAYDTRTRSATELGKLPGAAEYGAASDLDLATSVNAGPTSTGIGFAAKYSMGAISEAGSKVFSFDLDTPNSLKYTTTTK